ncbi:Catalyzes the reversible phosphatidyl group transfer from one phosphatidylglycerol molecule to another to form cardiolipin (CL) (diphosphatidylglycerol) and glycerol [Vibrio sp. B1FLJ16]|nr:Catalyzes the reversible phosphatidyl group transfer from one phosphatidylglycerol molecule to another to form cardiolipin (CL) (diphosphatidylglycerol) and glycerol [Vibrio sp. B1FLJ16]CAE6897194.1 Catalyzes the reversible phosphatidyl group transfer from one phosphatidylglycerol molecule to another to form cardiolipin (CL) (diphosphatidylglycerol) and glycerol [Vibrio sp. B1FLJ16]
MDMRSLWLNYEVTLAVDDEHFTKEMALLQDSYIKRSYPVEQKVWEKRTLFSRFLERVFYLFNPLL